MEPLHRLLRHVLCIYWLAHISYLRVKPVKRVVVVKVVVIVFPHQPHSITYHSNTWNGHVIRQQLLLSPDSITGFRGVKKSQQASLWLVAVTSFRGLFQSPLLGVNQSSAQPASHWGAALGLYQQATVMCNVDIASSFNSVVRKLI